MQGTTKTYRLEIKHPASAMTSDKELFQAMDYFEAVQHAHKRFQEVGRNVYLFSGEWDNYWWHRISAYEGKAFDRNLNSGVPTEMEVVKC